MKNIKRINSKFILKNKKILKVIRQINPLLKKKLNNPIISLSIKIKLPRIKKKLPKLMINKNKYKLTNPNWMILEFLIFLNGEPMIKIILLLILGWKIAIKKICLNLILTIIGVLFLLKDITSGI